MNPRHFVAILFLGLLFPSFASAWDIQWVDQYGNGVSTSATGGKSDLTGVYVAGSVFGALPGQTGAGGSDVYVRKYDFTGNRVWTRQFGTPATDFARNLATDPTGVYLAGRTEGTLPGQLSAGGSDAFVRKYDSNGNVLWTRQFGTSGFDAPMVNGVSTHSTGVYVAGETLGTFPGAPGGIGLDIFFARLDAQTGQPVWIRQFGIRGLPLTLTFGGVSADDTGVSVTGNALFGQTFSSLVRKYDFDGNLVWARDFTGPSNCSATFFGIASHAGNSYVVGQWDQRFYEDPAGCGVGGFGQSFAVGVVQKFDSAGSLVWKRRLKGSGEGLAAFTGAKTVWASETGVYVGANLTTTFAGHANDGPRRDRSDCPGLGRGSSFPDNLDAYVRRYDFGGNVIWTHQFGSDVFDLVAGIGTDATGVYVAGDTSCRVDEGETFSGGSRDGFVLRMAIEPTSLSGQVQLIVGRLETLNDAGRLTAGGFGSLVQQLEAALGALDRGNLAAARQALNSFVQTVSTLGNHGVLTGAETGALIAAANGVIAQL